MQFEENPYSATEVKEPVGDVAERPKAATVLGAIHIAFGVVAILMTLVAVLFKALGNMLNAGAAGEESGVSEEVMAVLESDANELSYLVLSIVGFILAVLLIAAGVGLMRFQLWGRSLSMFWAGLSIVTAVGRGASVFLLTFLPLQEVIGENPGPELSAVMIATIAGGICGTALSMVYPIVVLVFMTRKKFVNSLKYTQEKLRLNRNDGLAS